MSTGKTMTDQTVENCIFRNNVTGNMYNINTGISVENVRIINNIFDNGWTAINVLGKSTKIRGNTLINMRGYSMQLGDGDSAATKGHEGYEITHNTWRGLGSGAVSGATVFGIGLFTSTLHHTDNSAAQGNIIANNNFIDSVSPPGVGAVIPISVQGNALVSNNLISGITTLGTGTSDIAITAKYASGASGFQRVSLLNNVVEDTPISRAGGKGWNFGIFVTGGDNAVYHLGGNKVAGIHSGGYAFFTGVFPSQPIVTFDGEVYNGNVGTNTALKNFDFGADTTHYNTPIYGDLLHGLRTAISDDIRGTTIIDHSQLSDNSTTPSVAGGKIWYSNNTNPTSITAFPDAVQGQVITIMFYDNNTTIVAGASMKLQGAVNFVATPNDTITLFYGFQGKWYEVSRSVN